MGGGQQNCFNAQSLEQVFFPCTMMIIMIIMMVIMVIIKKIVIKMRMDEWTDATDQLAASARAGRSSNPLHHHEARILNPQIQSIISEKQSSCC